MNNLKEKYVAKGPLIKEAKDKLKFILADKCVTPEKLSERVTTEVIQPLIDAATEDLQNQINSLQISGLALSNKLGYNPYIGISQKRLTEEFERLWSLIVDDLISLRFSADVSEIYVGELTAITLNVRFALEADSISVMDPNGNVLKTVSDATNGFTCIYEALENRATDLTFTATATIGNIVKTETLTVPVKSNSITRFDIAPLTVEAADTTAVHFAIETLRKASLELFMLGQDGTEESIWGPYPLAPNTTDTFNHIYNLVNPEPGTLTFRVKVFNGDEVQILDRDITVNDVRVEITQFNVSPTSIYTNEETVLTFNGEVSNPARISLVDGETEIESWEDATSFTYDYPVTLTEAGLKNYAMKAVRGSNEISQTVSVTAENLFIRIDKFTANAESLFRGEPAIIHFEGKASIESNLKLYANNVVIGTWNNASTFSMDYTINPESVGIVNFRMESSRAGVQASDVINIPVVERLYAYVGGGATYQEVMVVANRTSEYGPMSATNKDRNYIFNTNAGDYMWFIFPNTVSVSNITSGGVGVPYTRVSSDSALDNQYNFYRSVARIEAGSNNITVSFV